MEDIDDAAVVDNVTTFVRYLNWRPILPVKDPFFPSASCIVETEASSSSVDSFAFRLDDVSKGVAWNKMKGPGLCSLDAFTWLPWSLALSVSHDAYSDAPLLSILELLSGGVSNPDAPSQEWSVPAVLAI